LVVVTPAVFKAGWCPDGFTPTETGYVGTLPGVSGELCLVAALVPRPRHLSGWDMAEGRPKETSRLVAAGSVYFLIKSSGRPFEPADAEALWLAQLGDRTREGFGCVVPGIWAPGTHATRTESTP
jgi:CRISPR-associated protein Cmr3